MTDAGRQRAVVNLDDPQAAFFSAAASKVRPNG